MKTNIFLFLLCQFFGMVAYANPTSTNLYFSNLPSIECSKTNPELLKFWRCKEIVEQGDSPVYDVQICCNHQEPDKVVLYNFAGLGSEVGIPAYVEGNYIVIIPTVISGYEISGSGYIEGNYSTILWEYNLKIGAESESVTAIFVVNNILTNQNESEIVYP